MTTELIDKNALIENIAGFINDIGIPCRQGKLKPDTFLPGIDICDGTILFDPELLLYPGDLLHEAGHVAVLSPSDRQKVNGGDSINGDIQAGGAEMAAIAWSWAALKHLDLEPQILFHEYGYKGDAANLIENFSNGRFVGHELLQWMQMTRTPNGDIAPDEHTYPKMKNWLRPEKNEHFL